MDCTVTLDWRSFATIGLSFACLYLVYKNPDAAKEVLVHVSDAVKEYAIASRATR